MVLTFVEWLNETYGESHKKYTNIAYTFNSDFIESDLCYDINRDDNFPNNINDKLSLVEWGEIMMGHIVIEGGCGEAIKAFIHAWDRYVEYYFSFIGGNK